MKQLRQWLSAVALLAGLSTASGAEPERSTIIKLTVHDRDPAGQLRTQTIQLVPTQTAVVVVDMWDRHWCQTYTARVGNLIPRMNQTLDAARKLGLQIVFAPSDVVRVYEDTPQRKAMKTIPQHPELAKVGFNPPGPPGPTDFCECGPNRPCRSQAAWTRQHPDLRIDNGDLIGDCNQGRELLNLCAERHIDTLIYMGVASNMCVQYRSMGLRNLKDHGLRVLMVSDLVEAITSNGLDGDAKQNLNFTPAGGTARVQRHVEQYLAPTFESRQLIGAAGPGPHATDPRPHVVLIAAEQEYESQRTLPAFAKQYLDEKYRCTCLAATGPEGTGRDDVPGLAALYDADLVILSMRRRSLPVTQMDHLERYLRAGRPLVALRTSVVAFQTGKAPQPGHVVWERFDQQVLGCNYQGYNPTSRTTGCDVWATPATTEHPLLKDVAPKFHSPCWIYRQQPLADSVHVLLEGRWSDTESVEPVAWTNTYEGGRVFYTTLGHPGDFENPAFCQLLLNAIQWTLNR